MTNHFLVRTEWHFEQRWSLGRNIVPIPVYSVLVPGASSVVVVLQTWQNPLNGPAVKHEIEQ